MSDKPNVPLVLVAEDEGINRLYITTLLRKNGYTFMEAENGRKAVEKYKSHEVGLILMDVSMPDMDGLEATGEIRLFEKEESRTPVPIIALTAHAYSEDLDRCLAAGMNAALSKPYSEQQILELIRTLTGGDHQ